MYIIGGLVKPSLSLIAPKYLQNSQFEINVTNIARIYKN